MWDFSPSLRRGFVYVGFLIFVHLIYIVLLQLIRRQRWTPSFRQAIVVTVLMAAPLLFTYPYNANDLYRYAMRGRITAQYGGNPYQNPPSDYTDDPLTNLAGEWVTATSPYGPLWELMAAGTVNVARSTLLQLLGFKLLSLIAHVAIVGLLYRHFSNRPYAAIWWGLNPALLLIFVADGHNDAWMILCILWGWTIMFAPLQRPTSVRLAIGLSVIWLAVLTKAIALLAIPFIAISGLKQLNTWAERIRLAIYSMCGITALTASAFIPFGSPLDLTSRLITEAAAGASFSPAALIILLGRKRYGVDLFDIVVTSSTIGLVLVALLLLGVTWFTQYPPSRSIANIFIAYIIQALNFRLWYTSWPTLFLLLDESETPSWQSRYRLHAGMWLLFIGQCNPFIYSHLWRLIYDRVFLPTHFVGVPLTFIFPFILALPTSYLAAINLPNLKIRSD